jgi:flagellar biogenesis protein FliO
MGASLLRVTGALLLVIALFFAVVWLFKNWRRFLHQQGRAPKLSILEVKSLGQRHAIYVVGYEQQRLLLSSSPGGVSLLSHLPEAAETETAPATAASAPAPAAASLPMNFVAALQQALSSK